LSEPFTLEGKFQDDITPAIVVVRKSIEQVTDSTSKLYEVTGHENDAINESIRAFKAQQTGLQSLNDDLQKNINRLTDQKRFLSSSEYRQSAVDAEKLRLEVNLLTKEVQEEASAMVFAKNSATPLEREIESLNIQLGESITKLRAQKEVLQDPGYKARQAEVAGLKSEIAKMTESTVKNSAEQVGADAVEKGIFSNMRTRREALVMAHEAMMGRTKNLMGSAMVFAEYADLDIMKTVTSMITPVTVGVGLAAVAVIGLGVEMVKLSAEAAESYHKMALMGEQSGSTAQDIIALQHAAIGTEIPTKALADAFGKFTLRLGEHGAWLAAVGITAREPKEAFAQLMDVAAKTSDVTERNRILNVALGRSWEQLMPLLSQGGDAFRDALKEMQIPDSTKKRYEEINALQEENAKNWDTIKQHAAGAAAGVLEDIDKIKLGFTELAKQRGLLSEIGNVAAKTVGGALVGTMVASGVGTVVGGVTGFGAAVYGLYNEGDDAAKRMAARPKPEGGAGMQGPSEALLKQRSAEEATLRKNDIKTALADEDKRYKDEFALAKDYSNKLKAAGQKDQGDVEKAERAHQMRVDEIRKSFQRKTPKGHTESDEKRLAGMLQTRETELAGEKAYQDAIASLDAQGIDRSVATVQAGADKKVAETSKRYDDMVKLAHRNRKLLSQLERDEAQEIQGIQKDATSKILTIYAKSDSEKLRQDEKNRALTLKDLDKQAEEIKKASEKIAAINVSTGKELPGSLGKKDTSKYDLERQAIDQSAAERKRAISNEIKDEKQKAAALQAIEANSAAKKAKVDRAELEERKKNYEKYSSIVQSYAQGQLSSMLQGEFTLTKAKEAAKTAAINFVAEEATKRIASFVETLVFQKAESAVANAESIAQAQLTGAALAESYATAAALASIATMGAADVAGGAGLATTVAAAHTGFAGGGIQMGPAIVGERRAEVSTPTTPQRITQTSNSTVNSSVGGMTVNINTGASVDRVAGVLTRAGYRRTRGLQYSSR